MKDIKINFKKSICLISLYVNAFFLSYIYFFGINNTTITITKTPKSVEIVEVVNEMDDWEIFTMALIKVESSYDSLAVSSKGAKGYFQITPIYIKEVNRIHGTNYTMDDVTNFESAYQIFDLMQQAHNQDYDIDKAIILHNGEHEWYRRRVMNVFNEIKKYEEIRSKLKKQ